MEIAGSIQQLCALLCLHNNWQVLLIHPTTVLEYLVLYQH